MRAYSLEALADLAQQSEPMDERALFPKTQTHCAQHLVPPKPFQEVLPHQSAPHAPQSLKPRAIYALKNIINIKMRHSKEAKLYLQALLSFGARGCQSH